MRIISETENGTTTNARLVCPMPAVVLKPGLHEPQLQVEWSVTFL